jgi:hypothetical protein
VRLVALEFPRHTHEIPARAAREMPLRGRRSTRPLRRPPPKPSYIWLNAHLRVPTAARTGVPSSITRSPVSLGRHLRPPAAVSSSVIYLQATDRSCIDFESCA